MKTKTIAKLALALVILILLGAIAGVFGYCYTKCRFGHKYGDDGVCTRCGHVQKQAEMQPDNAIISDGDSEGMTIKRQRIARADYETYGVSPQAETAHILTATILPNNADNRGVDWSMSWANAESDWAKSKAVGDYATLAPSGLTCTVSFLQDFGEQIIITATSQDNPAAKATCTADYVQRITGLTINMPDIASEATSFTYSVEYSAYTLAAEVSINTSATIKLTTAFQNKFEEISNSHSPRVSLVNTYANGVNSSFNGSTGTINLNIPQDMFDEGCWFFASGLTGYFYCVDRNDMRDEGFAEGDIIDCFRQTVNAVSGAQATFDITYFTVYNGQTYSNGTKTVECRFDGQALHIPVETLTLDIGSIIV